MWGADFPAIQPLVEPPIYPALAQDPLSENLLDSVFLFPQQPLWGRTTLGSKGFREGASGPLCEDCRQEREGESRPYSWNLLIFLDPELSEGRGSILRTVSGSLIEKGSYFSSLDPLE